ncbi:MAG TPA: TIGR03792 family protein [Cyanobacteria bacterium UBA8803]|nr:TIGR03792 family protein [Cyanobacteria bacterium UBA9273]HBL57705.1 TIGR03792 family protein [Cyanobacteria bacterium UBA8803]
MVIEWLKVRVSPELRERFIHKDAEIWTPMLASCRGFISKEVWIDPATPTEVVLLIRWETHEDWKSIPAERLAEVQQNFERQFGEDYQIIETAEYQVRKFPVL